MTKRLSWSRHSAKKTLLLLNTKRCWRTSDRKSGKLKGNLKYQRQDTYKASRSLFKKLLKVNCD